MGWKRADPFSLEETFAQRQWMRDGSGKSPLPTRGEGEGEGTPGWCGRVTQSSPSEEGAWQGATPPPARSFSVCHRVAFRCIPSGPCPPTCNPSVTFHSCVATECYGDATECRKRPEGVGRASWRSADHETQRRRSRGVGERGGCHNAGAPSTPAPGPRAADDATGRQSVTRSAMKPPIVEAQTAPPMTMMVVLR